MADTYVNYSYILRSSGPIPIGPGSFLQQSFGIDRSRVTTFVASTTIRTKTNDMTGAGGDLISANWQRMPYLTSTGQKVYNGTEVQRPVWLNRDHIT